MNLICDIIGAHPCLVAYTVDDLLAWLERCVGRDFVFGPDDGGEGYFAFALWNEHGERWEVEIRHSPTLLSALEQVVREVHE